MSTTTPGALTVNGSTSGAIAFGDISTLTLTTPQVTFPGVSPTAYADAYEWTIPAGWVFLTDGTASTGAGKIMYGFNANSIQVRTTADAGGQVRVRAVDYECGERRGNPRLASLPQTLPIVRTLPTLTIISNRSPQGGSFSLFCGERLEPQQVRASSGGVPSGGGFSNYTFTTSGIVRSFCCLNTASPGVSLNGTGTGTVALSALYTRNGASTTVTAPSIVITARPEVATPVFLVSNYDLCLN
ncbi:hypothetical protein GCM10022408_12550 [Hymenobacter fastidiosus]|uniref:PKD-like domain-containing protein n=1 Tax=Hymenobacter fastidiosus TaxID=486264 RepID=A0ABP7RVL4_9BACT